jgi:tetratricopeptide (TPR) repeat protein
MNNIQESLLFLPNWTSKLDDTSLSQLISSIGQDENIIIVIISISEDDKPILYEHARISKTITDKQIVKELLITYQVIQLPSSVMISKTVENDDNNVTKFHMISPKFVSSDEVELKATDLFAEAVKAYENFDLSLAANYFDKAISKDPFYKSALFNLAGLLHMIDYPILSIHYIERVLLLDKEDMIAHSFLWALIQPPEMGNIGIAIYRNLSENGDIKASSKLAALTGEGILAGKGDPKYAEMIYDDMGVQFEDKLVIHLGYKGPWDLYDMIKEVVEVEKEVEKKVVDESMEIMEEIVEIFEVYMYMYLYVYFICF